MGVDWFRMRPLPGVSRAVLTTLVRAQAAAFLAGDAWFREEFDHLVTAPAAPADPGWPRLRENVEVESGPDIGRRVAALQLNPAFPAEWRLAAYRSFLPAELPAVVRSWRAHLDRVRQGAHRPYLYAWYRYATTRRLAAEWETLRERAATARERANAWAVRPALIDVRDRILATAPPAVAPAPRWGVPPPADRVVTDVGAAKALAKEWDAQVPEGQKVRMTRVPSYEEFLTAALGDPYTADLLAWMERAAADGQGLLLDW